MARLGKSKLTTPGVRLFRAVGPKELALLRDSGFRAFPAMRQQPFFCPVTTLEYAEQIARDWYSTDAAYDHQGSVVRFRVRGEFLTAYAPHPVGMRDNAEYRIPAEDLRALNSSLAGHIDVIAQYRNRATTR
jgi:hypothetical protein